MRRCRTHGIVKHKDHCAMGGVIDGQREDCFVNETKQNLRLLAFIQYMAKGFRLVIQRADVLRPFPVLESATYGELVPKCKQCLLLVLLRGG